MRSIERQNVQGNLTKSLSNPRALLAVTKLPLFVEGLDVPTELYPFRFLPLSQKHVYAFPVKLHALLWKSLSIPMNDGNDGEQ